MGRGSLEIRPLSAMLSPGSDHLERAVLSPAALDRDHAALRSDALPVSRVPLQFRQFPAVQREIKLARRGSGYGRTFPSQALDRPFTSVRRGIFSILSVTSPLRIPIGAGAGANMGLDVKSLSVIAGLGFVS
jgi:hypothetical protein